MRGRRCGVLAAVVTSLAAGACCGPLQPETIYERYVLNIVDGVAFRNRGFRLDSTEQGVRVLIADTLLFKSGTGMYWHISGIRTERATDTVVNRVIIGPVKYERDSLSRKLLLPHLNHTDAVVQLDLSGWFATLLLPGGNRSELLGRATLQYVSQ